MLLAGSVTRIEQAARGLARFGLTVERTGRYLGEPIPGFEADGFIRIAGHAGDLAKRIAASLGTPLEPLAPEHHRERLLANELERAPRRVAAAKSYHLAKRAYKL